MALEFLAQRRNFGRRDWRAEQVTLHIGATTGLSSVELLRRLHPLGRGHHTESLAQAGHGPDDRCRRAGKAKVVDKGFIDLHAIKREFAQVAERGIAGAEIIKGDADAECLQLIQQCERGFGILDQHRFGNLELVGRIVIRRYESPRWRVTPSATTRPTGFPQDAVGEFSLIGGGRPVMMETPLGSSSAGACHRAGQRPDPLARPGWMKWAFFP
jgi:hypothetical protein